MDDNDVVIQGDEFFTLGVGGSDGEAGDSKIDEAAK